MNPIQEQQLKRVCEAAEARLRPYGPVDVETLLETATKLLKGSQSAMEANEVSEYEIMHQVVQALTPKRTDKRSWKKRRLQ